MLTGPLNRALPAHGLHLAGRYGPRVRPLLPVKGTIPKNATIDYEVETPHGRNGTAVVSIDANGSDGLPEQVSSGLSKQDFAKFVQFFRQASPYVEGHRGKTFVIVIPGNVRVRCWRSISAQHALRLFHFQICSGVCQSKSSPKYYVRHRTTPR